MFCYPLVSDFRLKRLSLVVFPILRNFCRFLFRCCSWAASQYGLELPPGMPGISPALVTLVPGTALAKDIPAGDYYYPRLRRLFETVSDDGKSY